MVPNIIYAIIAVVVVSLISVFAAIPFFIKKTISKRTQLFLLSFSVGAILGVVFLDFIPEIIKEGYTNNAAIGILAGVLAFFIVERLIHNHHNRKEEAADSGHSHGYELGPMNLIGDAIHNFLDGIVIGSTFLINPALGLTTTVSIIIHEIPQELADFGVLLYAGYSKKKALFFNFLSAIAAIAGTVFAFILTQSANNFGSFIIPFAAGNFIYLAASNMLPQLHRHCSVKDTFEHILAIVLGIGLIYVMATLGYSA